MPDTAPILNYQSPLPAVSHDRHNPSVMNKRAPQTVSRLEATRRAIQHEFLRLLKDAGFRFRKNEKEPRGVQAKVVESVNKIKHGRQYLKTNHVQVSNWAARVRQNKYQFTTTATDYSKTSQNRRKFFDAEQLRIRARVKAEKLKSTQVVTVWSDKEQEQVEVSASTVRRALKRKFPDEPSMLAARPKGMKVGGETAHHNKCRRLEAQYLKAKGQAYVDGMFFADETKIRFREHKNKQIDIEWCYRGEANETNWFEDQRWPGQINLFLLQSKDGVEMFEIYPKTLNKRKYAEDLLPKVGEVIRASDIDFTCYMHDNVWRGTQPIAALDEHIGEGKWTKYMGRPCTKPHDTIKTPVRKLPIRVPKERCGCEFPEGPIHAAFNPKLNLAENTFAKIDRIITANKIKDGKNGRKWPIRGAGKKKWWIKELKKAMKQLNRNKEFFRNQYNGYLTRSDAFIKSRGKRLKISKW